MKPSTLIDLFATSASAHPGRLAVTADGAELTYADVDRLSNRVAAALVDRGVAADDNVGIYLDRGLPVVAAMVGVVKAGAAYLSVDTSYPAARREQMLDAGGVGVVISDEAHSGELEGVQTVVWERDCGPGQADPGPTGRRASPASPACVLFTSGSTGEPKGIVLEHRSIVALACNERLPRLGPDDRFGQVSSVSFDGITLEVWAALAVGAGIVVLPNITSIIAADLRRTLRRLRVTAMLVPAAVLNYVASVDRDAFSPLRHLCSGGDVLRPATCEAFLGGAFRGDMYNLYGPTEATTAATRHRVTREDGGAAGVLIGTPLEGYAAHVLDADLRQVSSGEDGELHIGGIGLAAYYIGRPALTADRFRPDPFGPPGGRLYATGDQVRAGPDGQLEYVGRFDHQVKVRGHRIEPAEVERAICRHPDVREAAVVVEEAAGDRQLVAFVVPVADTSFTADVRAYLAGSLPGYMLPSAVIVLRSMPTTSNGKRDLEALRQLRHSNLQRHAEFVLPETETERWLVSTWERQLNTEGIGAEDDFFKLGGHSLLALRTRTLIKRSLGVELPFRATFEHSTVRSLAKLIDELRDKGEQEAQV